MNIDWFTFTAQIINFLVLVALLRWLLYGPIVRAMKRREEKIASRLEEADAKRKEAEEKVKEYQEKSRQIDQQREERLEEARHEAHEEQKRLLKEAKHEIDRRREQWQEALRREQDDFLADLRRQAGELGLQVARRTLAQLADAELEQRMCDAFASRLEHVADEEREEIVHHFNDGESEVSVLTAFDMSDGQRERFRNLIHKNFEADADVSFERSADLICGLELNVGGYSFGWSIKEFLSDLDVEFSQRLTDMAESAISYQQTNEPNNTKHESSRSDA